MPQPQDAISKAKSADHCRELLYSTLEGYEWLARMIAGTPFLAKADNGVIVLSSANPEKPC